MTESESASKLGVRLAQAMVDRLQPHLPEGVELISDGISIEMYEPGGRWNSCVFMEVLDQDPGPEAHLETAIWMIMEHVQDFVMEDVLREPWPKLRDPAPGAGPTSAAEVRRENGGYSLLYQPVLRLPRITDEELGLTEA